MKSTERKAERGATDRLEARVHPHLKSLFQRAADLRGVTLSDFMIDSLHAAALQTLKEHEWLRLTERDATRFAQALLKPPTPNPRLQAAARRFRQLSQS